jgi:hypothetical protein
MKKHARRFVLMGKVPPNPNYLKKQYSPKTTEQRLEGEGWVRCGGGFSDPCLLDDIYHSYFMDQLQDVPDIAAIPYHSSFSLKEDYWIYGQVIKRKYIFYYLKEDRVEDRGESFHRTDHTKIILPDELAWHVHDAVQASACD